MGQYGKIDYSDGAGMNVMNITEKQWEFDVLKTFSKNPLDLAQQLGGNPCPSHTTLGKISKYFVQRYGFSPDCQVLAGTGDNPSSLVGLGIFNPGDIAISLGTSDTLFGVIA